MREFLKSMLVILRLLLLISCTSLKAPSDKTPKVDENGYVTIEVGEIAEKKEVNLDHPLYGGRFDDFDVYGFKNGKVKVNLETYEYFQSLEYQKQDIRSAEQALAYYQSIDPWNFISEKDMVIVDISYDAKYDVWGVSLVTEHNVEHFYDPTCLLDAMVLIWLDSNGQFLCRVW